MKVLTDKEFLNAPPKVQFIYSMSLMKTPMGSKIIDEAISEHPEYFPDEVEHRRKWSLVPKSVNDAYRKELFALNEEIFPNSEERGLSFLSSLSYEEFIEWRKKDAQTKKESEPLFKELFDKYYKEYGIEYKPF